MPCCKGWITTSGYHPCRYEAIHVAIFLCRASLAPLAKSACCNDPDFHEIVGRSQSGLDRCARWHVVAVQPCVVGLVHLGERRDVRQPDLNRQNARLVTACFDKPCFDLLENRACLTGHAERAVAVYLARQVHSVSVHYGPASPACWSESANGHQCLLLQPQWPPLEQLRPLQVLNV